MTCPECGGKAIVLSIDKPGDALDGTKKTICSECDYIVSDYAEECQKCNVVVSLEQAKVGDFCLRMDYHERFECARRD